MPPIEGDEEVEGKRIKILNSNKLLTTILAKIYETNFSVSVKQCSTGKVQFQFLNSFLLVQTKFPFWEEDWTLGYNSIKI